MSYTPTTDTRERLVLMTTIKPLLDGFSDHSSQAFSDLFTDLAAAEARIARLEAVLQSTADALQPVIPTGQVKAIGLMEVGEAAKEAGAEIERLRDELRWLPMESAPKTGKWILCWWPEITDAPFTCYWCTQQTKWLTTCGSGWDREIAPIGPSRWMPLPQPPEPERAGE